MIDRMNAGVRTIFPAPGYWIVWLASFIFWACQQKDEIQPLSLKATFSDQTTSGFFNLNEKVVIKTRIEGSQFSLFYISLTYLTSSGVTETIYIKDESNLGKELNLSVFDDIKAYRGEKSITFSLPSNLKNGESWSLSVLLKDETGTATQQLEGLAINEWKNVILHPDGNTFFSSATGNVLSPIVAFNNPDGIDITYAFESSSISAPTLLSFKQRNLENLGAVPAQAASCRFIITPITTADYQSENKSWKPLLESFTIDASTPEKVAIQVFKTYGFKNQVGKKGLIYVNEIVPGQDGYVSLSVKAER